MAEHRPSRAAYALRPYPGRRVATPAGPGPMEMGIFLMLAAALALVFAATLAVMVVFAAVLLALSAAAWRLAPRAARARVGARGGHVWVRYR